jgi:hypothetical protein
VKRAEDLLGHRDLRRRTRHREHDQATANSLIPLTIQSLGTVQRPSAIGVTARTAGTSLSITSSVGTDTSNVAMAIVEPSR